MNKRNWWPKLRTLLVQDGAVLLGAGLFGYGLWQIYSPLVWLLGGCAIMAVAGIHATRNHRNNGGRE